MLSKFVSLTFRNSTDEKGSVSFLLWIAFKICIFDFQKQLHKFSNSGNPSCELLSKFVSLTFRNSHACSYAWRGWVVNCFQNLYLWLSETAIVNERARLLGLWIAFKICIFDFQKQHLQRVMQRYICCELLSKFVSLTFRNSKKEKKQEYKGVVNCFQNLYLWLSETAISRYWRT